MIAGDLLNSQVKGINLVFPSDIYESRDYLDGINKQEQQESVNIAFWGFYYMHYRRRWQHSTNEDLKEILFTDG